MGAVHPLSSDQTDWRDLIGRFDQALGVERERLIGRTPFQCCSCRDRVVTTDAAPPSSYGDANAVPAARLRVLRCSSASEDQAEQIQLAYHAAQVARREPSDAVRDRTARRGLG